METFFFNTSSLYQLFAAFFCSAKSKLQHHESSLAEEGWKVAGEQGARQAERPICAVCGCNFLEETTLVDGHCLRCRRSLCDRCAGPAWICSLCLKSRPQNVNNDIMQVHKRRKITASEDHDFSLNDNNVWSKRKRENFKKNTKNMPQKHYIQKIMLDYKKNEAIFPEFGVDIVNVKNTEDSSIADNSSIKQVSSNENWKDNWKFQKKLPLNKFRPSAILVPNPTQNIKAHIGETHIDDLSDFSDYSDSEVDSLLENDIIDRNVSPFLFNKINK